MMYESKPDFDIFSVKTPCYITDEERLVKNLTLLSDIRRRTGCKILLAQKAFSMYSLYPLIGRYLDGTAASSLFEARLGYEEMGGETHIFSAAYREDEFDGIMRCCDHIVFNSLAQWEKYKPRILSSQKSIECGIRVNPEYSEQKRAVYDPCAPGSRLGVTKARFLPHIPEGISGLHMHTMCEQGAGTLERTAAAFEEKFGEYLPGLKWVNFGGGHHITRAGYDVSALERVISHFQDKYGVQVYLEPGEAVALNAGYLAAEVLDIVKNGIKTAVLDVSAACHMPDVLEAPYRPPLFGSGRPGEKAYTYRLAGPTCLAGDIIGDYSFDAPLSAGDRLLFGDMAIYTMVKNNTFNGINLPDILLLRNGRTERVRTFGYADFKSRL